MAAAENKSVAVDAGLETALALRPESAVPVASVFPTSGQQGIEGTRGRQRERERERGGGTGVVNRETKAPFPPWVEDVCKIWGTGGRGSS